MNIDGMALYSAEEIEAPSIEFAQFSLNHADLSQPYILAQVDGLDTDDIFPYYAGGYSTDLFFNMAMKPRKVALRIKLNPDYYTGQSPSDLRDELYKAIAYSRTGKVELRMMSSGSQIANVQGFITKFESALFTPNPQVQISMECPFPYLRSPAYTNIITPPVSLDELTITDNLSTAPHGFKFHGQPAMGVDTELIIQGKSGTAVWPFQINYNMTGATLYFSSEKDNKYLYADWGGGDIVHLSDKISLGQVWPMIFPGETNISFSSDIGFLGATHKNHYWGV